MIMPSIANIDPPSGRTVRVISDMHWGHPRSRAPEPAALAEIMCGVDMLVLCGDTAETHPCSPFREKGVAMREEFRCICRQQGIELIELAGNHDPDVELQMLRLWGGQAVATHGHALVRGVAPWSREFFRLERNFRHMNGEISPTASVEELLALARGISFELGSARLPDNASARASGCLPRELYHCFWPPARPLRILQAWLTCGDLAERWCRCLMPETRLFIFGHFHRSGHWSYKNRTMLNTGAWFKYATPYAVDMRDARLLRYAPLVINSSRRSLSGELSG